MTERDMLIVVLVIGLVIVGLLVFDILRDDKYGSYGPGHRLDSNRYGSPGMMDPSRGYDGYCPRCGYPYDGFNYTYDPEGEVNYSRYGPGVMGLGMVDRFGGYWYGPIYSSNYSQ